MATNMFHINDVLSMLRFCLKQHYGRRFYLIPLVVLVWPVYKAALLLESQQVVFSALDAQNDLIGFPIYLLAIGLGIGIIAKEIEERTLEVTYTVLEGAKTVWILKLLSAMMIIFVAEVILASITLVLFTSYPIGALFRVFQGCTFFLVLAMCLGALLRSELAAALFTGAVFFFLSSRFLDQTWSPIFNPLKVEITERSEIASLLIQHHIGIILAIILLIGVSFSRAQRRERLLDG